MKDAQKIINRLKALKRYTLSSYGMGIYIDEEGSLVKWDAVQEIIDEFEVKKWLSVIGSETYTCTVKVTIKWTGNY